MRRKLTSHQTNTNQKKEVSEMKKNKNSVVVAEPVVVEPLPVFEECKSSDAAERVRFHL